MEPRLTSSELTRRACFSGLWGSPVLTLPGRGLELQGRASIPGASSGSPVGLDPFITGETPAQVLVSARCCAGASLDLRSSVHKDDTICERGGSGVRTHSIISAAGTQGAGSQLRGSDSRAGTLGSVYCLLVWRGRTPRQGPPGAASALGSMDQGSDTGPSLLDSARGLVPHHPEKFNFLLWEISNIKLESIMKPVYTSLSFSR